jgi:hypothetical protein
MTNSVTIDQIVYECLVAYGAGTGTVPTASDAVQSLIAFFRPKFQQALNNDPDRWSDIDPPHTLERLFVLRCCQAVGRLAAQNATKRGVLSIHAEDVEAARNMVINANSPVPGEWCN